MSALTERGVLPTQRLGQFTALVVVNRPAVRGALVRRLHTLGAREVFETTSIAQARTYAQLNGPGDLVIADSTVVDGSGVALVTELRRAGWSRAVVLGPSDDAAAVRTALAAGVHGFVVTQAERVAPRPLTGPVTIVTSNSPAATGPESLSDREIEVLRQVADGRSNRDVAESLGLSSLTVKSHLARMARKLGTGDRAEMVVMALRAGLID